MSDKPIIRWGALWRSSNKLDGLTSHLLCENHLPVIFISRRKCREWIADRFGYIKHRKDLQSEPHGWKYPRPVRVSIKEAI